MKKRLCALFLAIILVTTMAFPVLAADVEKNSNLINSEEHESYDYNGNIQSDAQLIEATVAAYTLQDSTVYGSWSNAYLYYNCYAYALGLTDGKYWPGVLLKHKEL